jgi:hypothetical protein
MVIGFFRSRHSFLNIEFFPVFLPQESRLFHVSASCWVVVARDCYIVIKYT